MAKFFIHSHNVGERERTGYMPFEKGLKKGDESRSFRISLDSDFLHRNRGQVWETFTHLLLGDDICFAEDFLCVLT